MMRVRKKSFVSSLLVMVVILAACAGGDGLNTATPMPAPAELQPTVEPTERAQPEATEADAMVQAKVFIDKAELQVMESAPVQLALSLQGNLPTPCHQLRYEISGADEAGEIQVEVWSEAPANQECIQVLAPFEENIPLGTASEGSFTVFVNGEEVGSLDL